MLINSLLLVLFFIASGYVEGCSNRVFGKTNYFKYHVARLIQSLVPFYYMVYMFGWSQLLIALGLISWGFYEIFYSWISLRSMPITKKWFGITIYWWMPLNSLVIGVIWMVYLLVA